MRGGLWLAIKGQWHQQSNEKRRHCKLSNRHRSFIVHDYDICVCTDLDEVFVCGWREKLESIWDNDTDRLMYNYNWWII